MGLNLTLFIDHYQTAHAGFWTGNSALEVHRDEMLGVLFENSDVECQIKPRKMTKHMKFAHPAGDEPEYPLEWVKAGELAKVVPPERSCDWNKAVIEFMKSIDPKTIVLLWWH